MKLVEYWVLNSFEPCQWVELNTAVATSILLYTTTMFMHTDLNSPNASHRWDRPIRLSSSSRKSTSTKRLEMALSLMAGTLRLVRKSWKGYIYQLHDNILHTTSLTIRHSDTCVTAPLYASFLYASFTTRLSTTVVNQFTNSYRYMLGMSSREVGVHSYSASSKKSLSLEDIIVLMRLVARVRVFEKLAVAERWSVPPRCEDLCAWGKSLNKVCPVSYRILVTLRSSSAQAISKCSMLDTTKATWDNPDILGNRSPMRVLTCAVSNLSTAFE